MTKQVRSKLWQRNGNEKSVLFVGGRLEAVVPGCSSGHVGKHWSRSLLEPAALPSVNTLGKDHHYTRQTLCRVLFIVTLGKIRSAASYSAKTFCRVFYFGALGKITKYFAECIHRHSAKFIRRYAGFRQCKICRVPADTRQKYIYLALGKVSAKNFRILFFYKLCRVSWSWYSAK